MNVQIDNFLGVFEEALSQEFCDDAIKYYESMAAGGFGVSRQQQSSASKMAKDTTSVFISDTAVINAMGSASISTQVLHTLFSECYPQYTEEYAVLNDSAQHTVYEMKIQKTKIGGGYHVWHYESDNRQRASRLLNYQVYLNDVEEGGETEFLYLHRRVKPKAGTMLIYPASFTHTHRANPPISGEKYILNGWIEF